MKKLIQKIFLFTVALAALTLLNSCGYNSMIEKEEAIKGQWAQVENAYQRRSDLIPNLVNTVKGYADFEKSTLQAVTEARSKATSVQVDASKLTPETIAEYEKAQEGLKGSLSRLLVSMEAYPELKANQNFLELQSQLEGTENRIAVERNKFNENVNDYNAYIRKFPNNITAGMFSFQAKPYFKSKEGSDKAPEVKF